MNTQFKVFATLGVSLACSCLISDARASLQLVATFTEQDSVSSLPGGNNNGDTQADLFSLEVIGTGQVAITSVKFTTPEYPSSLTRAFFDTQSTGAGSGAAFGYAQESGSSFAPTARVNDGASELMLDFNGPAFGSAGDSFSFTIDVDGNSSIVRGFDPTDYYTQMRGTSVEVSYNLGSQTGLSASFALDTPMYATVENAGVNRAQRNLTNSVSGSVMLIAVPEASSLLVWLLISGCGFAAVRWSRLR